MVKKRTGFFKVAPLDSRARRLMGFTILELVLVVALMGLAAGFIGPQVGKILDFAAFKQEYKTVYNWLKKAQATAVIEGVTCRLFVSDYDNQARYWINYLKDGKTVELVNVRMKKTAIRSGTSNPIYFMPSGGVEPPIRHLIILGPRGTSYPRGWKWIEIEPWGEMKVVDLD